jgi:type I restriction enzyme S subunit/DNA-damage-inducible protein D
VAILENPKSKYQPYAEYKDSGMEWLGKVPIHWDVDRLKWGVRLINEKVENGEPDTPYLGLENVESWTGKIIESDFKPEVEGASNSFQKNDVLFGKLRPYLAKVVHAQSHGMCTSELLVLRPQKYWPRYLFYYMLSRSTVDIIDSSTYGVKMPRANWDFVGNLPFLLPPLPEQQAIADFLDRETNRIDGLINKINQAIEKLQEYRSALITAAVTGKIDVRAKETVND